MECHEFSRSMLVLGGGPSVGVAGFQRKEMGQGSLGGTSLRGEGRVALGHGSEALDQ